MWLVPQRSLHRSYLNLKNKKMAEFKSREDNQRISQATTSK